MSKKAVQKKEINPEVYDVIESPLVTEKSQAGTENNKVTFKVSVCATKGKVKNAIEGIFMDYISRIYRTLRR